MPEHPGLIVEDLRVDALGPGVDIVAEVSFVVRPRRALGIVGESGCGKTTVALALLGFAREGTKIAGGSVRVDGYDLLAASSKEIRSTRGRVVSFVPQNPARSLSPGMRVGDQLAEMATWHLQGTDHSELLKQAWEAAQLPYEEQFLRRFPHQLSGGQQQRVAIAMALVCQPSVIVMDEPTTGLDVITQARLLDVIRGLRSKRDVSIVYISHDLGVVRNLVDDVAVMYGGRIVEAGPVDALFSVPRHPYTRRLLEAIPRVHRSVEYLRGVPGHAVEPWHRPPGCPFSPRCDFRSSRCDAEMPPHEAVGVGTVRCWHAADVVDSRVRGGGVVRLARSAPPAEAPLLTVRDLVAGYAGRRTLGGKAKTVRIAVQNVSLEVSSGTCVAVVGESGSGKTTLGRCIAGLHAPIAGEIRFDGLVLQPLAGARESIVRRRIQIVFQDPDSSLNPSMSIGSIVRRPLKQFFSLDAHAEAARVSALLEQVHLTPRIASRLPHELSGGEKQRVAIARALAAEPTFLICDEVTSALDVAVQASILELLRELRSSLGMAMLFISHDLAVVRTISDRVLVLNDGQLVEAAEREAVFSDPQAEYTRRLLDAVPDLADTDYPGLPDVTPSRVAPTSSGRAL